MSAQLDWHQRSNQLSIEGRAYIDGAYVDAIDSETFACINPATGKPLARIASCKDADVDRAVASCRGAFGARRLVTCLLGASASCCSFRPAAGAPGRAGAAGSLNVGKPITNAFNGDIVSAATTIQWYAEAIDKVYGEVAPSGHAMTTLVIREALGVVAAVVPWNYPLSMACWKLGPALASGNSVVLKPAEQSPLTAIRIAQLAADAGIPKGVLNVVPGFGETAGRALGMHMDVDAIGFTGSTEVGKLFMQYSGPVSIKRIGLELGGKSPHIVLADCSDLDAAAQSVAAGIFANAGQVCNAGSRLIVDRAIKDVFWAVAEHAARLRPGDPLDPDTRLGAIVSEKQLDRIMSYVESGTRQGASLIAGGQRAQQEESAAFHRTHRLRPTSRPICGSRKRSSGRCCPPSPCRARTKRSPWPTRASTAWPRASGPTTSKRP